MSSLDNITSVGTVGTVMDYILKKIEKENLKPNSKLESERDLAKTLGVSRSSVREAIERLTALGYLETIERVGTFISSKHLEGKGSKGNTIDLIQIAPILDLMEVRMILESNFIPLVVQRHNERDIMKLNEILDKLKSKLNNSFCSPDTFFNDSFELHKIDLDFHYTLAKSTHNLVIIELMKVIINRIKNNKQFFIESGKETIHKDIQTFEQLIKSIQKGDTGKAIALYNEHLNLVIDEIKKRHQ